MNSIDWDKIPEGFDWVAVDWNGDMYGYKSKPTKLFATWCGEDYQFIVHLENGFFDDWRDSLQHRPSKEPKIEFGPRPEKLWVGMKGKTRDLDVVTLEEIDESENDYFQLRWSNYRCTDMGGTYAHASVSCYDIVEWEQPPVTCCDPEPEPDWKAKYEQLREHYAHLESEMKAQECAYNVVVAHRDRAQKQRDRFRCELKEAQAELNDVYKAQSKLNRIVRIVNEMDGDEWECDDDD